MPLNLRKKEIEAERKIGYRYAQFQARAEALVPGAGRDAIEPLLWDATASIIRADVQPDRVVLDGMITCQSVYRQGEESSLRALSAKSAISQVIEIAGASAEMLSAVHATVEAVEARYENGHMVFIVSIGLHVRVLKLEPVEIVTEMEDDGSVETLYRDLCLTRLAAEANETAVLTSRAELAESLDARGTLMDWGSVRIDSAEADLGGIRVKGSAIVESLIASGIEGKPAEQIRSVIAFDKLIELPEWLTRNAHVTPELRTVRTQVEPADAEGKQMLTVQADVYFEIAANVRECTRVLTDAYSYGNTAVRVETQRIEACVSAEYASVTENVRGVCMLREGMPSAGVILCVRARPVIAEVARHDARTRLSGLMTANVLYIAENGSPAAAEVEIPFDTDIPQLLEPDSAVRIEVAGAEAGPVMSDRVEVRASLVLRCETRRSEEFILAQDVAEGDPIQRTSGYTVVWPGDGESAWQIGKRYAVSTAQILSETNGVEPASGQPIILKT